jgi:hypothetical protein
MLGLPQIRPVNPLTGYGLEFMQAATDFAANIAHPWVVTTGDTGTYYVPDARNSLRAEEAAWGWNVGPSRVTAQYSSAAFSAQKYGLADVITDDDRRNWLAGGTDLDQRMVNDLTQKMMIAREVRVEAAIDAATFGTTAVTGNFIWDAATPTANPRLDINKASTAIRKKIGRAANAVIFPGAVWDVVVGSQAAGTAGAAILEAIKYTGDGARTQVTPELAARYFNLDIVQPAIAVQQDVTKHVTRTIAVGLPEAGTYIWDQKEAYVFYNDFNPGQRSLNFGASFGPIVLDVRRRRDDDVEGDFIRVKQVVDEKIVCNAAMNVLTTVIT